MPRTPQTIIEPSIVKHARESMGFSIEEVSKKLKISVKELNQVESEISSLPISVVEKFATIYKRPFAYFFLSSVPPEKLKPKDFRIIYESEDLTQRSPKLLLAIRRARYIQTVVSDFGTNNYSYQFDSVTLQSNIDQVSRDFRHLVNISLIDQHNWGTISEALRHWKDAIESLGIFILQDSLPKSDVSAFCLVDQKPYIIVLNSYEKDYRRIFSLFHEIGHVLLHKSGICKPDDLSKNSYDYIQIEKFCNQFAASLLVPRDDFIQRVKILNLAAKPIIGWKEDVKSLANYYKVSQEVILRRLVTIDLLPEEVYEQKHKEIVSYVDKKKDRSKELRIPQYVKSLSQNGKAFTSLVLQQYLSNRVSYAGVGEYLNLATKHIPRLQARIDQLR